jgi:D-alanyl-D-alanine carboxypeptidase
LEDTVEQWLPGLLTRGADLTIEELLNHSSGLADYVDSPRFLPLLNGPVSPRQLVRMATAEPELFRPGQGTSYTNTGYVLLGMIIERATHRTLDSNLRSTVFAPTGMTTSSLAPAGAAVEPIAHGDEKGVRT